MGIYNIAVYLPKNRCRKKPLAALAVDADSNVRDVRYNFLVHGMVYHDLSMLSLLKLNFHAGLFVLVVSYTIA